jgi:hypothetical protein
MFAIPEQFSGLNIATKSVVLGRTIVETMVRAVAEAGAALMPDDPSAHAFGHFRPVSIQAAFSGVITWASVNST